MKKIHPQTPAQELAHIHQDVEVDLHVLSINLYNEYRIVLTKSCADICRDVVRVPYFREAGEGALILTVLHPFMGHYSVLAIVGGDSWLTD